MTLVCPRCRRPAPSPGAKFCPNDGSRFIEIGEPSGLQPGQLFQGRFLVRRRLGQGGMATVYECEQQPLGRRVAVKILRDKVRTDPEMVKRFLLEARAMSRLSSPHAIQVYEFDKVADGAFFLVMEYLDGVSLREHLERVERLSVDETVRILRAVGEALADAHAKGIVHRDMKPDNVFLVRTEAHPAFVKVLDFGIARAPALVTTNLTELGELLGTPAYMSPEMVLGQVVDARADIFAVGVMMYEMLAGVRPFKETDAFELMHALLQKMPDTIRAVVPNLELPRPLHQLMWRCLAKDRGERPRDGAAFVADLDAALRRATATDTERMRPLFVTGRGMCGGETAVKAMIHATAKWPSLSPALLKGSPAATVPPGATASPAPVDEFPPTSEVPKLRPNPPAPPAAAPVRLDTAEADALDASLARASRRPWLWAALAAGALWWFTRGA